jgi:hypothetical protein
MRGVLTLDDLIASAWEGLSVGEVVCCPACGGEMASRGGTAASHADSADARADCADCGAQLF